MLTVLVGVVAFIIGILMGYILFGRCTDGNFKVNTSDPEKDIYTVELAFPLEDLEKNKRTVKLLVKREN